MPHPDLPFPPMEAELVEELPPPGGWQYEPKWDGFRGVLENVGGELALWSRNGRPLLRYFPELRTLGDVLPAGSALDGEIVIARDGRLDFDAMQLRLHPAESRVRRLSAEIPAEFIAFDILLWKGKPIHREPLAKRRKELEKRAGKFRLSPISRDLDEAQEWLNRLEAAGLDGVVCKRLDLAYLPGSLGDARVVPGREARTTELRKDITHQCFELHMVVARDAGIWRLAGRVGVDEPVDDLLPEDVRVIERIEGDAERRRGAPRVFARFVRPAAARSVGLDAAGHETHPYADDVLATLQQQGRRHR